MAFCRWCERNIPEGSPFCPFCGQVYRPELPCQRCGSPVAFDTRLCMHCGHFQDVPVEAEEMEMLTHTEASSDSVSAWPVTHRGEPPPEPRRMIGARKADPYCLAALFAGAVSLIFIWIPGFNIAMAAAAILLAAVSVYRHFAVDRRYGGLFLNITAAALGIAGILIAVLVKPLVI